mmetsp:Transcript_28860/g.66036  ORF Transcript_28860/g.66036 Transcript_28860/m.66036 type:complete len:138 (+) Transcript_28860:1931-2344(+)
MRTITISDQKNVQHLTLSSPKSKSFDSVTVQRCHSKDSFQIQSERTNPVHEIKEGEVSQGVDGTLEKIKNVWKICAVPNISQPKELPLTSTTRSEVIDLKKSFIPRRQRTINTDSQTSFKDLINKNAKNHTGTEENS